MKVRTELESRLNRRAREDEQTVNDVINRLLDESQVLFSLEEAIRAATDSFDQIDAITIRHATRTDITVYTSEVDERGVTIETVGPEDKVLIKEAERTVETELTAVATPSSPELWNSKCTTTVYVSETVRGVDSVEFEDGISYLKEKLQQPDRGSSNTPSSLDEIRAHAE